MNLSQPYAFVQRLSFGFRLGIQFGCQAPAILFVVGESGGGFAAEHEQLHELPVAHFDPRLKLDLLPHVLQRTSDVALALVPVAQASQCVQHLPLDVLGGLRLPLLVGFTSVETETLQEVAVIERSGLFQARRSSRAGSSSVLHAATTESASASTAVSSHSSPERAAGSI